MNNKILLTTCAVGDFYVKKVVEFLLTDYSKLFDIHILTDNPLAFKGHKVYKYESNVFNYFDKFIFGLDKITKQNTPGLIYDAKKLSRLKQDLHCLDFKLDKIQFFQFWTHEGTIKSLPLSHQPFWEFFKKIIQQEKIEEDNILLIHEDRILFPIGDYSEFLTIFTSMKKPFTENSYKHHPHNNAVGNGEGVALGYTLLKTNSPYKVILNKSEFKWLP